MSENQKSRITSITYARLKNLGNWENARVEATAVIAEGEKPADIMKRLKQWVKTQLEDTDE